MFIGEGHAMVDMHMPTLLLSDDIDNDNDVTEERGE
jgi:hypothetical protein